MDCFSRLIRVASLSRLSSASRSDSSLILIQILTVESSTGILTPILDLTSDRGNLPSFLPCHKDTKLVNETLLGRNPLLRTLAANKDLTPHGSIKMTCPADHLSILAANGGTDYNSQLDEGSHHDTAFIVARAIMKSLINSFRSGCLTTTSAFFSSLK